MPRDDQLATVRRFNRTVTSRVGALNDHYLARHRTLGESRVLWEIGVDGCDVRDLRARLALDSGYLSRLLRSLEADGLVKVGPSVDDRRIRRARLTAKGRSERALLDRRSDELAESLLSPLSADQQGRLVQAMDDVARLLTAGAIDLDVADPTSPAARHCLAAYAAELDQRFTIGFDPGQSVLPDHRELSPPTGLLVVATLNGEPVGCGGLRFHRDATDIKRMWVSPTVRGLGLGRRLLAHLEARAAEAGPVVRLETNAALTEAIALYRSSGYREVEPFNDERYGDFWFEKHLDRSPA